MTPAEMTARFEVLERKVRRLSAAVVLLVGVASVGWLLGAQRLGLLEVIELRATRIVIVSEDEKTEIEPGHINFTSKAGRANLGVFMHGAALSLEGGRIDGIGSTTFVGMRANGDIASDVGAARYEFVDGSMSVISEVRICADESSKLSMTHKADEVFRQTDFAIGSKGAVISGHEFRSDQLGRQKMPVRVE